MLVLSTLALAADIPVDHHVLVRRGAAATRRGGGWSAVPAVEGVAWPATVVADLGEELEVRFAEDRCVESLVLAGEVDLTVVVREADLLPMVAEPVTGSAPTGASWQVGAGTPVVGSVHGVQVDVGRGTVLTLPAGVPAAPFTWATGPRPWTEEGEPAVVGRGAQGYGTFRGVPVTGADAAIVVRRGNGRVTWEGECVAFTFDGAGPAAAPLGPPLGQLVLLTDHPVVRAGARLTWPDGAPAGTLPDDLVGPSLRSDGDRVCFDLPLTSPGLEGSATLPLCAPASAVRTPAPLPPAVVGTVTAGGIAVLGALDPADVEAVVRRQLGALETCYRRELVRTPTLEGDLAAKLTVGPEGAVGGLTMASSLADEPVAACVSRTLRKIRFAAPTDGGEARLVVPFRFRKG